MTNKVEPPIFYDPTKHRWRYYKILIAIISVFLTVAFVAALVSISKQEKLPDLPLVEPFPTYRSRAASFQINPNPAGEAPAPLSVIPLPLGNLPMTNSLLGGNPTVPSSKLVGFYVNWDDASLTSLRENYMKLDELIPEWLHLANAEGGIALDDPIKQGEALDFLDKNRPYLRILPLINNYNSETQSWDNSSLKLMLENPAARSRNVKELLEYVQKNNFVGICIDYENIPLETNPYLGSYMKELYDAFHALNLEVVLTAPAADSSYDLRSLVNSTDYFILMTYDEHWPESSPGPIASQGQFVNSLKNRFAELPLEKIIVALGNYGYDWRGGQSPALSYTFQDAVKVARESGEKVILDPNSLNETFEYYDKENILHQVFFLDAVTVFNQINLTNKFPIAGYALWRLGSEDPSTWKVLQSRHNLNRQIAESVKILRYGYAIDYEGHGEILKVVETPKEGRRSLVYDEKSSLITGSEIIDFPSPFIILRWGGNDEKKIALTFDDGPDQVYTPEILKILKNYQVPATFFVIGVNATQNQDILKQMYQEGHEIGSHTFTHPDITATTETEFKFELNAVESLLASTLGHYTLLFRPPYAEDVEPETPERVKPLALINEPGYYTVGMHIDPKDWSQPGVSKIIKTVLDEANAGSGNIVLLHDSGGERTQTVASLPKIIEGLQNNGFKLVTVSELTGVTRNEVMPSVTGNGKLVSNLSQVAFIFVNWLFFLLSLAFTVGIFLGIARFLFIAVLAVEQKIRSRSLYKASKKYAWYHSGKRFSGFLAFGRYFPKVSVIIPAYNEESVIVRTVRSILRSDYPRLEIVVIDDGSKDGTYQKVAENFLENSHVRLFTKPNGGKASALNFGIARTDSEIIIALDADTIFRPGTISKLVRHFDNPRIGAVAGNAKVGNRINLLTFWQALEYITSQNLDRRAFHIMNCITVVPGSVGAWRRKAILRAGGFSGRTLAEDADLTFSIIRLGYKVVYEDGAVGYTEAPDTVRGFIKQRFRWMFGTLQTAWRHKEAVNCRGCRALGFFAIPNIFIFQVFFPLISPFMDLTILVSLLWVFWQKYHHPLDYSAAFAFKKLLYFYLLFLLVDFFTSAIAFFLEKREDWTLLFWMFLQRFFYRQLMYYVAIKVTIAVIKGRMVRWGKLERKATVIN